MKRVLWRPPRCMENNGNVVMDLPQFEGSIELGERCVPQSGSKLVGSKIIYPNLFAVF